MAYKSKLKPKPKPKPQLKPKSKPKPKPKPEPKPAVVPAPEPEPAPAPTAVGAPVDYLVVDQPWSPADPATAETLLNTYGQDGWQLAAVYPDPTRERTRWIFSR